jgi:hypothetical protein
MPKLEVGLPQLFAVLLRLVQVEEGLLSAMLLEVLLADTLVYRHVFPINEVLCPHLLHPLQLSLLIATSCFRVHISQVDECLLVCSLVGDLLASELEMSLP